MPVQMEYSCYGYFAIDHAHNTYPIKNVECHIEKLFSLKKGDALNIKGIGELQVINLHVDEYKYSNEGKSGLYQEIQIKCRRI